uniref:Pyrin domain-containing protein n=1 Tax=Hucho hucho TaxID=62062 RepID=A0A4W5NDA0_9TELE
MANVPELLLGSFQDLDSDELKTFQWYLKRHELDKFHSIPKSQLENANRQVTVDKMVESYSDEGAVRITLEILRKMGLNNLSENVEKNYKAGNTEVYKTGLEISRSHLMSMTSWLGEELEDLGEKTQAEWDEMIRDSSKMLAPSSVGHNQLEITRLKEKQKERIMKETQLVECMIGVFLQRLNEVKLQQFQWHLTKGKLEVFDPIPKDQLKKGDRKDTVDKMVDKYSPDGAVKITVKILRKIKLNDLAVELENNYREAEGAKGHANVESRFLHSNSGHSPPHHQSSEWMPPI